MKTVNSGGFAVFVKKRWFRAVFYHASKPEQSIEIEFKAPYPIQKHIDYEKLAIEQFNQELRSRIIKIRDIEPVPST